MLESAEEVMKSSVSAHSGVAAPEDARTPSAPSPAVAVRVRHKKALSKSRRQNSVRVRGKLGLSQSKFAAILGISADTLQNWEQGRRTPTGPAKVLLRIAARHPEVLLEVV
jgi:DNA-binding transcriptional regulator YiaG